MSVIIFDTEATDKDEPELIEAAWLRFDPVQDLAGESDQIPRPLDADDEFSQRYRPTNRISYGAMAVHHILPGELIQCPPSESFQLPDDVEYMVGHSIDFDWGVVGSPASVKRICTYAMAQWVWQEADSYSQSALIYLTQGASMKTRDQLRGAHSALADVQNNRRLLEAILWEKPHLDTWSKLYAFSEHCRIPRLIPIGKLKGTILRDAWAIDYGYCNWLLDQHWLDPYLREGLTLASRGELPEDPA